MRRVKVKNDERGDAERYTAGNRHTTYAGEGVMNNMSHRLSLLLTLVALAYLTGACGAYSSADHKRVTVLKEELLREDLRHMRNMIKQYATDMGALPQSLEDLAGTGYIRSIPEDPMTGKRDWKVTIGEDPELAKGSKGVVDLHSSSSAKSSEGNPYSEW